MNNNNENPSNLYLLKSSKIFQIKNIISIITRFAEEIKCSTKN